nr:immunoglobulin heavy chain junction region [Macaca mulatta]
CARNGPIGGFSYGYWYFDLW